MASRCKLDVFEKGENSLGIGQDFVDLRNVHVMFVRYKISCKDCEKVYIGQTSRAPKSRTREHKRAVFTGDKNYLLAQHCEQTNHDFNFDDVEIVDRCSQWSRRLSLEAWHSIREPNSINGLCLKVHTSDHE